MFDVLAMRARSRSMLARLTARRSLRPWRRISPLAKGGERVDIDLTRPLREDRLDIYQLSHLRRYQFAQTHIERGAVVADFACGTGYGSVLLASRAARVVGGDRDEATIAAARSRYGGNKNLEFQLVDLIDLSTVGAFDSIVSFETLEHFSITDLGRLLFKFSQALRPGGNLIFSTPYKQVDSAAAQALGWHQTFMIDELKLRTWLGTASFDAPSFYYQDYATHEVAKCCEAPDFIIGIARKPVGVSR
jgi:SAM-dependent methyltransferase